MLKWFNIIIIILLNIVNTAYAINNPNPPKDPSSEFIFNDPNNKTYPVNIFCKGKEAISGVIYLRLQNISIVHQRKIYLFNINKIKSIEYLEWQEYKHKKNSYVFYPSKILLTIKDNQQYILDRLPEFNKVEFSDQVRKENIYTYFYDYWGKNKWNNSNNSERVYPTKHPLPGTLVKIEFINKN